VARGSPVVVCLAGVGSRSITTALAATVLAWAACLIPLADALSCGRSANAACLALIPASAGSAAIFGLHVAGASCFGVPPWYGFLFRLGYTIGAVMSVDSVRRRLAGRMNWKGRTYP
jgi:chlorobactene glucosyltransferase